MSDCPLWLGLCGGVRERDGDYLDFLLIDVAEEAPYVIVSHTLKELHISPHLWGIELVVMTELIIDDLDMSIVIEDNTIGALTAL